MADYIEREAAVHLLMTRGRYLSKDLVMDAAYEVSKIPAADVAPVVRCQNCIHPEHYRVVAGRHENGRFYSDLTGEEVANILNAYASGMLEPVVRCKDCIHYEPCEVGKDFCCFHAIGIVPDDFCSYGEREDGEG